MICIPLNNTCFIDSLSFITIISKSLYPLNKLVPLLSGTFLKPPITHFLLLCLVYPEGVQSRCEMIKYNKRYSFWLYSI
ncbi:hypothetical protein BC941DRAFT_516352 [Chlamydoabsidia padenii]|nr:hypothetical protein BC941DRAFT_516352 [Chlamydoabsidia padenii]